MSCHGMGAFKPAGRRHREWAKREAVTPGEPRQRQPAWSACARVLDGTFGPSEMRSSRGKLGFETGLFHA